MLTGSSDISSTNTTREKTRSGAIFSPWLTELGPPIRAPSDFDLSARIKAAMVEVPEQQLPDEDDGVLASFQGDATLSPGNPGNPSPPEAPKVIPPFPVFEDPSTTVQPISKHQYHAREHSKKRRRAAAAAQEEEADGNRQLKASAKRHRDAAVPLHADTDMLFALGTAAGTEDVIARDDAGAAASAAQASEPIVTDYSLKMENVPVASTAFQGRQYKQTAADREPKPLEKLWEMGLDIVEWNGL